MPMTKDGKVANNRRFSVKKMALKSTFGFTTVNHNYTEEERQILNSYHSLEYLPPHSKVYRNWLQQQPARLDWDRWLMMGIIGICVGLIGFLLHQIIDIISECKWHLTQHFISLGDFTGAYAHTVGYSLIFLVSSSLLVLYQPAAAGSGIPEIIGFLNGTRIKDIFKMQTLIVKFLSCAFAVGCGMPVGYEGPMIHLGSLVAAGVSQFKSATFECTLPFFSRFRNSEDRRNFISAGAAAGIASAFGAPVGGLLFAMEEVSSFWKNKLGFQVFFCCMVATFTTDILNSAFHGFKYKGDFGLFKPKFISRDLMTVNVIAVVPVIILGILGGLLGSAFVHLNLLIAKRRKRFMATIKGKHTASLVRVGEPMLILLIVSALHIFLPALIGSSPVSCVYTKSMDPDEGDKNQCLGNLTNTEVNIKLYVYNITEYTVTDANSSKVYVHRNGSFSELATLFYGTGEQAVYHLYSKNTHKQFGYTSMAAMLIIHFFMSCWAAGTYMSCGIVVPMLLIGGLYGRMLGRLLVDQFGIQTDKYWAWMDPGAFALLGSVSFFAGVTRLTLSLTVIMVEITNDIHQLLLIMISIMVAKWTGDLLTHPLYHALLEFKCIPFLTPEPILMKADGSVLNLDLFTAQDAMTHPVKTVNIFASVHSIAKILLGTSHGGFPVVKSLGENLENTFCGEISRLELRNLMTRPELFIMKSDFSATVRMPHVSDIMHPHFRLSQKSPHLATDELLQQYMNEPLYCEYYVNLSPYINDSGVCVQGHFSLHRAYILFRTMGLRQMTVVNHTNQVVGTISRKDLMGFSIEERLERLLINPPRKLSRSVVLALKKNYGNRRHKGTGGQGGAGGHGDHANGNGSDHNTVDSTGTGVMDTPLHSRDSIDLEAGSGCAASSPPPPPPAVITTSVMHNSLSVGSGVGVDGANNHSGGGPDNNNL